jgi:hypothetical protein
VYCLDKAIHGCLEMCLLAPGAAARSGEAFSFLENISTGQATEREDHELSFLCRCGQSDVRQVLIDFPLPDADSLRDFPGGHFFVIQEQEDLLTNGLRVNLVAHGPPSARASAHHGFLRIYRLQFSHSSSVPAIDVISKTCYKDLILHIRQSIVVDVNVL